MRFVDGEAVIEFRIEPVEELLQLGPGRALGGNETREVDDHFRKVVVPRLTGPNTEARRTQSDTEFWIIMPKSFSVNLRVLCASVFR